MRAQHGPALSLVGLFSVLLLTACGGGGGGGGGSPNNLPTADAGNDITVRRNATVSLDGSGSSDSDGDTLAYRWTQTSGAPVTLSSSTSARPTFSAPNESGTVTFALVASDGKADSSSDTVSVTVENLAPTAAAAGTVTAGLGTVAMLDGSTSADPDGDPLTYTWTQISGPVVTIETVAPGVTRFQVPTMPVTLVFALTVSDGEATSVTINVTVNVVVVTLPNQAPVVSAGTDFAAPRRSTVVLSGWGYDPDTWSPLTYSWEQTAGPPVTLAGSTTATPSFTAPETPAELTFVLRGSDGVLTSSSEVTVDVRNFAPDVYSASITPNIAYTTNDLTLGAQVTDPDNDSVTTSYEWLRNGVPVGSQTSSIYPASLTTKNDVITARLTADDGLEHTTVEVSTTILDSPAVLTAQSPPPTALNYGDTANFTVSATDADGDAIPGFEVAFGPAGFAVTSQGDVTWTAAGPLFDRLTDFNWGVRVTGDMASLLSGTFAVTDAARDYPVRRTGVQIPVQHNGLKIGDFDGDGDGEMLVGSPHAVYVLSRSGSAYQQSWVYPFDPIKTDYSNVVRAVAARDLDSDGRQEIFFSKGPVLVRLDGVSRREAVRSSLSCRALEVADLDGNGSLELICLAAPTSYFYDTQARVVVLNPNTLAEIWSTAELPLGYTFALGNVDNDAALEIVAAGGFVFDGQTHQNEWAYSQPFGSAVDTGDMDADGIEEIVGIASGAGVRAYSAIHHSPLWEYAPSFSDLATVVVADANGDGVPEAIAGNGQWGNVMGIGYNTATHQPQLLWQINSQEHGVTSIAVGDVDNDGVKEVVWGSGASSSGRDDFVVAGFTPTISVKWHSWSEPQLDGRFYGGALARIGAGASRLMFVAPSTNSGYAGMRAVALDPATGEIEISATELGSNWAGAHGVAVADYDNDNVDELLLGTANLYSGYFAAYDFAADSVEWQSPQASSTYESATAVTHADMNGDGRADLIGLTFNGYIYVYDVYAQALLWKSTGLGGGLDLAVADLDDDGELEIVAAVSGRVVVYGQAMVGSSYLERASVMDNISDLAVGDLDGDDQMEIYGLHSDYTQYQTTLNVFDADLQLLRAVPLGVRADSIFIEDSTFARKNLLIATGDNYPSTSPYELWAVDPVTGADVWHSPSLAGSVLPNSLQFVDTDGDGDKEITFGTNFGMHFTR
jgi:hypothetical protein